VVVVCARVQAGAVRQAVASKSVFNFIVVLKQGAGPCRQGRE
jgi:hypothetical protein